MEAAQRVCALAGIAPGPALESGGLAPGQSEVVRFTLRSADLSFYGRDGKPSLDRYVVVQLLVGTDRSGVNRDASRYGAPAVSVFVFDGGAVRTLTRLGDLPAAVAAMP